MTTLVSQIRNEPVKDITTTGNLPGRAYSVHSLRNSPETELSAFCLELYNSSPDRFKGMTFEQFNKHAVSVLNGLGNISESQKLELMKSLLTQTMPEGAMGADNLKPGHNPQGRLCIMEQYKGKSMLEYMADISEKPLCQSLSRQGYNSAQFLTSLVQDFTNQNRIDQGLKNTCSVTCLQSHQFAESPAVMASRISELLTQGKATSPDGKTALTLPDIIIRDERTLINSLYQSALMNSVDGGYNSASDLVNGKVGRHAGLYARQLHEVLNKATGKPHRVAYLGDQDYRPIIDKALDERKSLIAVVSGIGTGTHIWHDVRVVDRKDGYIYFINPWSDQYIESGKGVDVIDKQSGLCRMQESRFLSQAQYLVYETGNPADFNFKPDGRDEEGGEPAQFFTVDQSPDYLLFLRRLQRIRESIEGSEMQNKKTKVELIKTRL